MILSSRPAISGPAQKGNSYNYEWLARSNRLGQRPLELGQVRRDELVHVRSGRILQPAVVWRILRHQRQNVPAFQEGILVLWGFFLLYALYVVFYLM